MIFEQIPITHQEFIEKNNDGKSLNEEAKDNFALALIHRSYGVEKGIEGDNERLEFLGDAVIGLAVSEIFFKKFLTKSEGFMSKKRAGFVNEEILAIFGKSLKLDEFILLGKGEKKSNGAYKPSIISSALEAYIGAYFLSHGYDETYQLIDQWFIENYQIIVDNFPYDYKSKLQEELQRSTKLSPLYKVHEEKGPDHSKIFIVGVYLGESCLAKSEGKSKKRAEQNAAKLALETLDYRKHAPQQPSLQA